jgi:L-iditol 2-dehydrogenase
MWAMRFHAPGDVRYEQVPCPQPDAGELIVRIGAALTCGTDLKCYRRGHPVLLKDLPSAFGHEFAGEVVAVGEGVENFHPGDRVVCANSAPCYQCFYCHQGQTNLCEDLDLLNGAYAEYIRVPARIVRFNTYALPAHVPDALAAFCEPLAVCLRGVEESNVRPGARVAVLGLGPIGQLLVRAAKWKGAHVTAFARNAFKRETALRFGLADAVVDMTDGLDVEAVRQQYTPQGRGFDVVIEAVGLPEMWEKAVALSRRGGTVNLFAGCKSGTSIQLDTRRLHYDEITLLSLFHHTPTYFKKALSLIAQGEIDPSPLISARMGLAELPDAFALLEAGRAIKVAIQPRP